MTCPHYYLAEIVDEGGHTACDSCGFSPPGPWRGEVEAREVIEALGLNFALGNAIKYVWRAGRKTPGRDGTLVDLRKARDNLDAEIARLERGAAR